MRMTLLPVGSLQSLNLKQAAHLPNKIDRTNASLIIYNFFWYSNMAENMTNQNVCCPTCLHVFRRLSAAEAKEEPLVSMMYQGFSACSHHNWCTSS
ncbi:hypothetical protein T07_3739 [Trichinella nelsoni]|uniref:Uncharacterized protein n=1 Tax=Trichinella nelsoni TaxID=6336 RepID=A0A0V0S687_9BILA|nr:hypothetical protein T07_3739 [Trichinella nelsoni]